MTKEIQEIYNIASEIKGWNDNDIASYEDAAPNMDMLEARQRVIESLLKKLAKLG